METPKRVAKAYVNDLWAGRYTAMSPITSFPSDGYDGIIIERNSSFFIFKSAIPVHKPAYQCLSLLNLLVNFYSQKTEYFPLIIRV